MDRIWAPWRTKYVSSKKQGRCIFCKSISSFLKEKKRLQKSLASVKENYVVFRTGYSLCMLNIFPYNNGHLMVSPMKHVREFSGLNESELLDLFKTVDRAKKLLDKVLNPEGYNIGINISKTAGAGIVGHLHIHIVPRWQGDTNFMPVIYNTKVISQSLDELCRQLRLNYVKSNRD